jgi:hypothetical protein
LKTAYWIGVGIALVFGLWLSGPTSIKGWRYVWLTLLIFGLLVIIGLGHP